MSKSAWKWAAVALLALFVCAVAGEMGRILMRDVTALTFTKGKLSAGRRAAPVPQQLCRGSACGRHQPDVVQCTQVGWDGDAQWKCTADLEGGLRFGEVEVTCEGYDFPEDPYILRGSCGLEYTLVGEANDGGHSYGGYDDAYYGKSSKGSWGSSIFLFVVLAFVAFAIYSILFNPQPTGGVAAAAPNGRGYGGGGYPGGGGGGYPGGGYGSGYGGGCAPAYAPPVAPAAGGGFWNGMLTGGLMGYMLGGRNRGYGGYGYGARPMGGFGRGRAPCRRSYH